MPIFKLMGGVAVGDNEGVLKRALILNAEVVKEANSPLLAPSTKAVICGISALVVDMAQAIDKAEIRAELLQKIREGAQHG